MMTRRLLVPVFAPIFRPPSLSLGLLLSLACNKAPEVANEAAHVAQLAANAPAGKQAAAHESSCIYAQGEHDANAAADSACPHGDPAAGSATAQGDGHYGAPFALAQTVPLAHTLGQASPSDRPVRVEGRVEAVCQKKGCWMVLRDGENTARILMKDHGFSVPMDCRGKKAVVEGQLSSRTFTAAQVQHLEDDAHKAPAEPSATPPQPRTEWVLTATGVEISQS